MTIVHRRGKEHVVPDALSRSVMAISAKTTSSKWYDDLKLSVLNRPDDYPDFRVDGDQLKKYLFNNDLADHRYDWKIIPSPEARAAILKVCHDDSMHIGMEKTLEKVRQNYYWPKMVSQIRAYIRKCPVCKEIKPPNASTTPPMGDMRVPSRPWEIIAIDYIGPLPRSKTGNQYVLVALDLFSKWVQLHPFAKISSKTLCMELTRHWFHRNSVPAIILTDNATSFTSKEFQSLLSRFGIKHWLSSRYHSQANPVERVNRAINTSLRSYARNNQREWDTRLSEVEVVINSTVHSSTGFTPFRVARGEEIVLNGMEHKDFQNSKETSVDVRLARIRDESPKLFDLVRKNLEKAYSEASRIYNLRIRQPAKPFSVGETVYRKNTKLSNAQDFYNAKLGAQYIPCTVLAKHGSSSYELADQQGRNVGIWPACLLKPA